MSRWISRALVATVVIAAIAAVAAVAAFVSGSDAVLETYDRTGDPSPAEQLLGRQPEEATNWPPVLLSYDDAAVSAGNIAFRIAGVGEAEGSEPITTAAGTSEITADDGPSATAAPVEGEIDFEGVFATIEGREVAQTTGEDTTVESAFPAPPPAARGSAPHYEDPSASLLSAAGWTEPSEVTSSGGISATEIVVSGLVSQTLIGEPFRGDVCVGAQARFGQANHNQEISRMIRSTGCLDDEADPLRAEFYTGSMAAADNFAIVPLASPFVLDSTAFENAGMVYVGAEESPVFCGATNEFSLGVGGIRGCPVLEARGFTTLTLPVLTTLETLVDERSDLDDVVVVVPDSAAGESIGGSRALEASLLGFKPPHIIAALTRDSQPLPKSWATVVDPVLAEDPDIVIIETDLLGTLPDALRADGYQGLVVHVGEPAPELLSSADRRLTLSPFTVLTPGLDLVSRQGSGWTALVGAAASLGVEEGDISRDFISGYLAADLFVKAVADTPEPLTSEAVAKMLNSGWWYGGVEGVSCGAWWPAARIIDTPCLSAAQLHVFGEDYVPLTGLVEIEPQVHFDLGN